MELVDILGLIGAAGGGGLITQAINWRINRKKASEDVKSDELDNIRKSMEVYQTIIADQNTRITDLTNEVNTLREQLRTERNDYQKQIAALQSQIVEINRALGIKAKTVIRENNTTYHERKPKAK